MSALLVPCAVVVVALTGRSLWRTAVARRRAARAERRAVEVLRSLAGEIAAGSSALQALRAVVPAASADRPAGSGTAEGAVEAALTAAAAAPDEAGAALLLRAAGPAPLVTLAAAVSVSAATGAPLADLLGRLASVATRRVDDAREVQSVLAGPRATAGLLAGLPALGLLLSAATGGSPVGFLLGTPAGRVCLLAGVLLDAAGLRWVERFARRAGR